MQIQDLEELDLNEDSDQDDTQTPCEIIFDLLCHTLRSNSVCVLPDRFDTVLRQTHPEMADEVIRILGQNQAQLLELPKRSLLDLCTQTIANRPLRFPLVTLRETLSAEMCVEILYKRDNGFTLKDGLSSDEYKLTVDIVATMIDSIVRNTITLRRIGSGLNILELATEFGNATHINRLVDAGCDVNARSALGVNILIYAIAADNISTCAALLDLGVKPIWDYKGTELPIIYLANKYKAINCLEYLLERDDTSIHSTIEYPFFSQRFRLTRRMSLADQAQIGTTLSEEESQNFRNFYQRYQVEPINYGLLPTVTKNLSDMTRRVIFYTQLFLLEIGLLIAGNAILKSTVPTYSQWNFWANAAANLGVSLAMLTPTEIFLYCVPVRILSRPFNYLHQGWSSRSSSSHAGEREPLISAANNAEPLDTTLATTGTSHHRIVSDITLATQGSHEEDSQEHTVIQVHDDAVEIEVDDNFDLLGTSSEAEDEAHLIRHSPGQP